MSRVTTPTHSGDSLLLTKFGNSCNLSICSFHTKVPKPLGNPNLQRYTRRKMSPLTPRQLKIREKFRMIAGTLIYVSITVRPDITTVLNRACQGMANPTRQHIVLLERTLEYLASNPDLGLVYNSDGSPLRLEIVDVLASKYKDLKHLRDSPYLAFSDADFASLNDPRLRSTSVMPSSVFRAWFIGARNARLSRRNPPWKVN